jgi:capsular polysaccharide biosynthesis protein
MKKFLLRPPAYEDLLRLLAAWRVWVIGAALGALAAGILYLVAPPQYRARATVLVDQNVELVIPDESTDLRKFNYLQRETDKLVEIAWSDQTLARVSAQTGLAVTELRDQRLRLTQPGDGGWHFFAIAPDPETASRLASAWALAFVEEIQSKPESVSPLLEINFTQQKDLPVTRTASAGLYVFCGALLGAALLALGVLFFDRRDA